MQTFSGMEYLKIDIANKFGLDKINWDDRLKWFEENKNNLDQLTSSAKEPASFYAAVKAYNAVIMGAATGHMISLDATSSGAQVLSALTRDYKASRLCNVVDVGSRQDLYTNIHKHVGGSIDYDRVKKACMTSLYNSEEQPQKAFGDQYPLFCKTMSEQMPRVWALTSIMLDLWDESALEYRWMLPDNFNVVHKVMGSEWTEFTFKGSSYSYHHYVNKPVKRGRKGSRSILANITHALDGYINREMCRRAMHDPKQIQRVLEVLSESPKTNEPSGRKADTLKILWAFYKEFHILSSRVLDFIDPHTVAIIDEPKAIYKLLSTYPTKPFEVISIHDMFRVHPNYGNDIRRLYNETLAEINESTYFNYIMSVLTKQRQTFDMGDTFGSDIRKANYALS